MNAEELRKKLNLKPKGSQQSNISKEVHEIMNPDHFKGLLRSRLTKVIDQNSLEYLFQKVSDTVQYSTVTLVVFADGGVVYSENGVDGFKDMYLKILAILQSMMGLYLLKPLVCTKHFYSVA